jgi:2-aminoadipate transaminase
MDTIFSDRISSVPRSFIREILKATSDSSVISFAGGLPNKVLFPAEQLKQAAIKVFDTLGADALQYSNSEGHLGLRQIIAERYSRDGLSVSAEDVLVTNGSQQGLDLLGTVLINEGDNLVIEEPGYLGAIQAFSIFRPSFRAVPLTEQGIDIDALKSALSAFNPKLIYVVPNFQNPSGISYSEQNRREMATLVAGSATLVVEDDPYGDLRYFGTRAPSFKSLISENTILLGSFSKTMVPGLRLGWVVANRQVMDKLIVAKQASDLHTNQLTQCILYQYLRDEDLDAHIETIKIAYQHQLTAMLSSIDRYFPETVWHTHPQGGMFVWAGLPGRASSRALLELAIRNKVIFVPGDPFYIDRREVSTMRLNFTCANEEMIREGIARLGRAIERMLTREEVSNGR